MGCGASSNRNKDFSVAPIQSNSAYHKPPHIEKRSYKHPSISHGASKAAIAHIKLAIKKNDYWLVNSTFAKYKIKPNECVGDAGYGQTPLHVAANNNCYLSTESIISVINENQPGNLEFFWSIPDSDGNTPIMAAAFHSALEALVVLLQSSLNMPVDHKNQEGKDLFQIAQSRCIPCLNILNYWYKKQEQPSQESQDERQVKQKKLEELDAEIAKLHDDHDAEKNSAEKIEHLKTEEQKLQAEIARENRSAEEIISEVTSIKQLLQNYKEPVDETTTSLKYNSIP